MDYHAAFADLLKEIGPGKMMTTAYDTAWVARLSELGEIIGEKALEWLRAHQLPDGSWGAAQPFYAHDRVICTLAAMNTLARRGRIQDRERLRRAEAAIKTLTPKLAYDPAGETVGFELIVPNLLYESKIFGGLHQAEATMLSQLTPKRIAKLSRLPRGIINRHVTVAFSAEMAGLSETALLDIANLQESNGSVAHSPSATAYFAAYVKPEDEKALQYLLHIAPEGMAPNVAPFDVFEIAWTLWNLALTNPTEDYLQTAIAPHIEFLKNSWKHKNGIGFAADYTPKDADDTGLVYDVITRLDRNPGLDIETVLHYEDAQWFQCYELESNPSISANIHVLGALKQDQLDANHPSVQKIITFLSNKKTDEGFWFDKWHASPYYATTQAIIPSIKYADTLVQKAVSWIINTQNEEGSWGQYLPTAEETAYCLQALTLWKQQGGAVPAEVIQRGAAWLAEHTDPPYPPLWIGKCLYCPELVVRSAILSALILAQETL